MAGTLEEDFWKLDAAYNAMMDEQAFMEHVHDAAQAALGRVAREQCPHLVNWPAEQLRGLDETIWRAADQFAKDVAHLDHLAQQKPDLPPAP